MILVDSSVWIDFLRDTETWQRDRLIALIKADSVLLGDLIACEILQGLSSEQEARRVELRLSTLQVIAIADPPLARQAARNYRYLRGKGVTVRSTIDVLIATRCIEDGYTLLHRDRDFEPFERELGLSALKPTTH